MSTIGSGLRDACRTAAGTAAGSSRATDDLSFSITYPPVGKPAPQA